MGRLIKLGLLLVAAWFVWTSWGAMPRFSEGFEEGLLYYRKEAAEVLEEVSLAGARVGRAMRLRIESLGFGMEASPPSEKGTRFKKL